MEVAIVIALISVLAAIGFGSIRPLLPRYRMIQVSKKLKNDLAGLRVLAVEQNRETRLLLQEGDNNWADPSAPQRGRWVLQVGDRHLNSHSWDTLPVDAEDGTDDLTGEGTVDLSTGGSREARDVSLVPWGAFKGPGVGNINAIVFSPKGWITNPPGDFATDGYIQLRLVNKAALFDSVDDSVTLNLSRGGMVRVESSLGGGFEGGSAGTGTATTSAGTGP